MGRGLLCLSVWSFAYLHSQYIQTTFYQSFVQIGACFNCSTPSKEKLSCLGEHYYHKHTPTHTQTHTQTNTHKHTHTHTQTKTYTQMQAHTNIHPDTDKHLITHKQHVQLYLNINIKPFTQSKII